MRKALLLLTAVLLVGLVLYTAWQPVPSPATRGLDTPAVTRSVEHATAQEEPTERNRDPRIAFAERTAIPAPLLPGEEYQNVHRQLVKRRANTMVLIERQRELVQAARSELAFNKEFERLQELILDEVRYRLALNKLENGQVRAEPRAPGPPGPVISLRSETKTSFTLSTSGHYVSFEFLPEEDPEVFAIRDSRKAAADALRQFQCDEFNRLPSEERNTRIESHLQASAILSEPRLEANRAYMSVEFQKILRSQVLPPFMEIDVNTYTVRRR